MLSARAAAIRKIDERIQTVIDFERYAAGSLRVVALADIVTNVFKVLNSGFNPAKPR